MADIPLNHFVRKVYEITTIPTGYYIAPFDRAAIVLAAYVTNKTNNDVTITVGFSGAGGLYVKSRPYYDYAKNILIAGQDTTSLAPAKIVLEAYDTIIASCNTSDAVTLHLSLLETINTVQ